MQYELTIPEENIEAHLDIESDIQKQKNGIFNFILRLNNGKIVDYSVQEYVTAAKYLVLKRVTIAEFTIARSVATGNKSDTLGTDVNNSSTERWNSIDRNNKHSKEQTKKIPLDK